MVAMLVQIRRREGMADAAFYDHWRNTHAAIVKRNAPLTGVIRYVQSHRVRCRLIDQLANDLGWQRAPDGLATLTWRDLPAMLDHAQWPGSAAAGQELRADEKLFVDSSGLCGVMARAEGIIATSETRSTAPVKLVTSLWRRPGTTLDSFAAFWRGGFAELLQHTSGTLGFDRYVQNHRVGEFPLDLAKARGWRPSPDGVGELWWPHQRAFEDALSSSSGRRALERLHEALAGFADLSCGALFLSVEHEIFNQPQR